MDEICTARNQAQRRCACAGRVKNFTTIEQQLQSAKEELLKVSGELSLIIAAKGKDITSAFTLTDAEKVLNCVSYRNAKKSGVAGAVTEWCESHLTTAVTASSDITSTTCTDDAKPPAYCESSLFGFSGSDWMTQLNGADSDILSGLQAYANTISELDFVTQADESGLSGAYTSLSNVLSQMGGGISASVLSTEEVKDSLAKTWGYDLFRYAHNNVCNRVLDSCFNGIYEACGTPKGEDGKTIRCSNGQAVCPYNLNSYINVDNDGDINFNFISSSSTYSNATTATCYGYSTSSGDPYSTLRGPVADARRSVLQKYALDANADCDLYGDQLKQQVQNVGYQKIAAQQLLQKKRQEFALEDAAKTLSDALAAGTNFNECISEIYDCYNTQWEATKDTTQAWSASRIKTYCAQTANVPHCYEAMICNPSAAQLRAVIDEQDSQSCDNTQDITKNNCRNIVTLNEILSGVNGISEDLSNFSVLFQPNQNSMKLREYCIRQALGSEDGSIRKFGAVNGWGPGSSAATGGITRNCDPFPTGATSAIQTYNESAKNWGSCVVSSCTNGYKVASDGKSCDKIEYSINYNLRGGSNNSSNPSKYTIEYSDITLSAPTHTNGTFQAWYLNGNPINGVAIPSGSTGDKSFYAVWKCNPNFYGDACVACPSDTGNSASHTGGAHPTATGCKCPASENWDTATSACT
jgi:hypothetical protein